MKYVFLKGNEKKYLLVNSRKSVREKPVATEFLTNHLMKFYPLNNLHIIEYNCKEHSFVTNISANLRANWLESYCKWPSCAKKSIRCAYIDVPISIWCIYIASMCLYRFDVPISIRCSSIDSMCTYWFYVPISIRCAYIDSSCLYRFDVSISLRCASVDSMCLNRFDVSISLRCAYIDSICLYRFDVPISIRCAAIDPMCTYWFDACAHIDSMCLYRFDVPISIRCAYIDSMCLYRSTGSPGNKKILCQYWFDNYLLTNYWELGFQYQVNIEPISISR